MASFPIPELKKYLPTLQVCYGFDTIEIAEELTACLKPFVDERKLYEFVDRQRAVGRGISFLWEYALLTYKDFEICTAEDFGNQKVLIHKLCNQYIQDENRLHEAKFILVFMAAIFNRNIIGAHDDDIISRWRKSWNIMHPDLLSLFIALSQPKHEHDTSMRIGFKGDTLHTLANKDEWFSNFLNNNFIKPILGDITVEEAEEELKAYSDDKGRRPRNPYLNYIINGTYNNIARFIMPDEGKVTVEQCRFLLEYLKIIGQVKKSDPLNDLNTLQSTVRSFLAYRHTPIDRHIKETKFSLLG